MADRLLAIANHERLQPAQAASILAPAIVAFGRKLAGPAIGVLAEREAEPLRDAVIANRFWRYAANKRCNVIEQGHPAAFIMSRDGVDSAREALRGEEWSHSHQAAADAAQGIFESLGVQRS